jgi:1-deoxyxylulose-5-phosphate synthase
MLKEICCLFCAQERLGFLPYSPLAAGFLTGKYSGERSGMPAGSRFNVIPGHADLYFNEQSFRALADLRELAKETGIPAIQLATARVLARPTITSVLGGARVLAHLESAVAATKVKFPGLWKWPAN